MYERVIQPEDLWRSLERVLFGLDNLKEMLNIIKETVPEWLLDNGGNDVNKLIERIDGFSQEFTEFKDAIINDTEIRVWYTD